MESGAGAGTEQPSLDHQAGPHNTDLLVSAEWLASRLEDSAVVVLHVTADRSEYDRGHLPGARFVPAGSLVAEVDGSPNELPRVELLDSLFESVGVSDRARVVIYGSPLPAARAFFTLDYLGHGERAALLDGGLEAWRAEGRPLSTQDPVVERGSLSPRPQPERVVDAAWVSRHLDDARVVLIDARPPAQFTGAEAGSGVDRPGHIPGAVNLYWEETLAAPGTTELRDPAALRTMFERAGVSPGDTVVTYCRTGMQASWAYFVARYLGYETRMYDASYLDWSRRESLPVER